MRRVFAMLGHFRFYLMFHANKESLFFVLVYVLVSIIRGYDKSFWDPTHLQVILTTGLKVVITCVKVITHGRPFIRRSFERWELGKFFFPMKPPKIAETWYVSYCRGRTT